MSIHITFTSGSNPYVRFNMTPDEFSAEKQKWEKAYDLTLIKENNSIYFFTATEKQTDNHAPLF